MQEDAADHLQDRDRAFAGVYRDMSASRTIDADVRRAQHAWFLIQVRDQFALVPYMVAHRDDVCAGIEDFRASLGVRPRRRQRSRCWR